jgi:hypothetical protein
MSACKAALAIKGKHYPCDMEAPHPGWAHGNTDAGAIWCSDGEAKRWENREPTEKQQAS